jgi:hypothetical protein
MTHSATYWNLTYLPRCLILLAKRRKLPSNVSLAATLVGIARFQIRPHWLREVEPRTADGAESGRKR